MDIDLKTLLSSAKTIATEAGARILEIYDTAFAVEHKEDASPLTAADLASHEAITAGLSRLTPTLPVLSEESASVPFPERRRWRRFWLVDPLDGTKEFVNRNGEFTVNIALIEDHMPVLGVVYLPVNGLCYFAARDHGAFRQESGAAAEPIAVSAGIEGPVRVVGSRSHAGASLQAFVERLGEHTLVSFGSSLKFCMVAEGRADIYPRLGPTSEWDTAAAQCVVEQAGGRVVDIKGERLSYNTKESMLNPHFLVLGGDERNWLAYLSDPESP
jgi:3'(2'), 5'-bisphosphate nucleotidase